MLHVLGVLWKLVFCLMIIKQNFVKKCNMIFENLPVKFKRSNLLQFPKIDQAFVVSKKVISNDSKFYDQLDLFLSI